MALLFKILISQSVIATPDGVMASIGKIYKTMQILITESALEFSCVLPLDLCTEQVTLTTNTSFIAILRINNIK